MLTSGNTYQTRDVLVNYDKQFVESQAKKTTQIKDQKGFRSKLTVNE